MTAAQEIDQSQSREARPRARARCIDRFPCGQEHRRIDRDGSRSIRVVAAAKDGERHAPTLRFGDDSRANGERGRVTIARRQPCGHRESAEQFRPLDRREQRLRRGIRARWIGQVFWGQDAINAGRSGVGGTGRIANPTALAAIHRAHARLSHGGRELHRMRACRGAPRQRLGERQSKMLDGHTWFGDRTGELRQHERSVAAYAWGMNRTVLAACLAWCIWCLACAAPTVVAITSFMVLKRMGAVDPAAGAWFAGDAAASGSFVAGQVAGAAFAAMAWVKLAIAPVALVLLAKSMLRRPTWTIALLVAAGVITAASHVLDTRTAAVGTAWHAAVHVGNAEGARAYKSTMDALHPWAERFNGAASLSAIAAGAVALSFAAPRRAGS